MNKKEQQKTVCEIHLTEQEQQFFCKILKRGVYKEFYEKHMLTGNQLNELLTQNE